ncbi:hypothetical protein ABW19_dt0208301 [Dactylella cylindrospora]|nr:hypothetical protein ABW19_dt0208301 [Dactylella cylindrospora]
MAILSKVVAVLALTSTAYSTAIPQPVRGQTLHKFYPRQGAPTGEDLAAGILDTPLVFGTANPDAANPEASFLFSNDAYYALQRYVYNGMQLASSNQVFENIYNKAQFEQAVSNPGVYGLTQTTFVGINNHCHNFWTNTVGQMTFFAENISLFGRTAAKIYREMSRLLDVMASVPRSQRTTDPKWFDALVDVYNFAERLHDQMGIAKNQSVALLGNINQFRGETIQDMGNLDQVDRLLNSSNEGVYKRIEEINSEIRRLKGEADLAQQSYDAARKKLKEGPAYAWIFPIGTTVYLTMSPKWRAEMEEASKSKNAALANIKASEAQLATFIHVTDDLKALRMQTDSVLTYIEEAVGLLGNASDGFAHMSASISAIMVELESEADATNPSTIEPKWFSDTSFRQSLNSSAEHWEDIYVEAAAFRGTAAIQIVSQNQAVALYDQNAQKIYSAIGSGSKMLRRFIGVRSFFW